MASIFNLPTIAYHPYRFFDLSDPSDRKWVIFLTSDISDSTILTAHKFEDGNFPIFSLCTVHSSEDKSSVGYAFKIKKFCTYRLLDNFLLVARPGFSGMYTGKHVMKSMSLDKVFDIPPLSVISLEDEAMLIVYNSDDPSITSIFKPAGLT